MIKTSTPELKITGTTQNKNENLHSEELYSPSAGTINNILNYSRSLDIRRSRFVKEIEIVKT